MNETSLAEKGSWKASRFVQPGTEVQSCIGFSEYELTGQMLGVQFIDGAGLFVTTRTPWLDSLPSDAPFSVDVDGKVYAFRGRAYGEKKRSGTMFLMPVENDRVFSALLEDLAAGEDAVLRTLAGNWSYSLSGSRVAIEAFYKCTMQLMSRN